MRIRQKEATVASGTHFRQCKGHSLRMALHAKLLKHNLLRVSKLKKLSHTTQAIERNFDRCAPGFAFTVSLFICPCGYS